MAKIPSGADVRAYNPVLSNFVSALVQDRTKYIAADLLEEINTERTGQVFLKSPLDGITGASDFDDERAPGDEFVEVEGNALSLASFTTRDYGLEYKLPDEIYDDSQLPYDLLQAEVEDLVDLTLQKREILTAAFVFDNTRFVTTNIGGTSVKWNAPGSNPMADLDAAFKRAEIATQNGQVDTIVFGGEPGWAFGENSRLISDLSITRDKMGRIDWPELQAKLANKYGLPPENVRWAKAIRNNAALGLAQSNGYVWGDFVAVGRFKQTNPVNIRGGVRVKGSTAFWARRRPAGVLPLTAGQDATGIYVSNYRHERAKSTIVRVERQEVLVPIRNASVQLLEDLT